MPMWLRDRSFFYEVGEAGGILGGVTPKKRLRRGAYPKKNGGGGATRNILVHVELT